MDNVAYQVARLVLRQDDSSGGTEEQVDAPISCDSTNGYDGRMGVRISAIFVILIGSLFGTSLSTILPALSEVTRTEYSLY
jgi:zinc transporter 1/2/3